MRKISKLSLVAAVAVAGFSTANAQPLEEAIKNVEVSGSVVYRYDNLRNENSTLGTGSTLTSSGKSDEKNKYKIGLNLSSKVNDYVKFNSRFLVADGNGDFAGNTGLNAKDGSDANPEVTLSHANFAFTGIQNTTITAGKQGLATPWTVAIDMQGNEQTGTGILALSTVGPVTAAAGYFNQTNLGNSGNINSASQAAVANKVSDISGGPLSANRDMGSRDIYVGALIADLSPVKLEAWYLDMADTFDTYTLIAGADFKPSADSKIGVEARYVSLDLDHANTDNAMYRLQVTGNVSIVNAKIAYTGTDKEGGLTALDQDAANSSLGWNVTANGIANADLWQGVLGVNILDNLNLSANYGTLKAKDGITIGEDYKAEETFGQLTYKMSKNLNTYVRYGYFEEKDGGTKIKDQDIGRVQVAYTF
ncbi:major outer membrane protein [Aliarcobacter butzleri]|uniref:major outer membrane protein n=1 Tax=Aliarcobacter butzleri TaxID=28197 RepID=UPI00125F9CC4|nr:major outer membrane protein [Aliarcobacter butzleri]MCT7637422.1 major outer membrane protein [Aliarcobacter butzleri]MCT7652552.1 major outer membrane protein [Aliarcobacter butzleri]